jgi:hypothetical protein
MVHVCHKWVDHSGCMRKHPVRLGGGAYLAAVENVFFSLSVGFPFVTPYSPCVMRCKGSHGARCTSVKNEYSFEHMRNLPVRLGGGTWDHARFFFP